MVGCFYCDLGSGGRGRVDVWESIMKRMGGYGRRRGSKKRERGAGEETMCLVVMPNGLILVAERVRMN